MKTFREATAEFLTGLLLILILLLFLVGDISSPISLVLAGLVLLGSASYQAQKGWHISPITWLLGIGLVVGGIIFRLLMVATQLNYVLLGLALVIVYTLVMLVRWRSQAEPPAAPPPTAVE